MAEECWLIDKPVHLSTQANNWLTETVGERGPGKCFTHLCEIAREPNRCIRPEHVVIGTKSTNATHMHELRRQDSRAWTGGRQRGDSFPETTCATCGESYRYEGAHRKRCG